MLSSKQSPMLATLPLALCVIPFELAGAALFALRLR